MAAPAGSGTTSAPAGKPAASSCLLWKDGFGAIGTSSVRVDGAVYLNRGDILAPRPVGICCIMRLASLYCLRRRLMSAVVVPLPVAMRRRRLPSVLSGLGRSSHVIE